MIYLNYFRCMTMEIKNIWFEFDVREDGYDENDENADVQFELSDGTKWCATFFT